MSILEIKNLSHIFDQKPLFSHADLSINNGEHVGIVGLNGAGKSTFINIIAGRLSQDEGEVKWNQSVKRGYLDQHADIDRSKTVMEYLSDAFDELKLMNERMENLYAALGDMTDPDEMERTINKANRLLETLTENGFFELDSTIKKVANGLGINNFGYDTVIGTLSGGQRAKLMLARLLLEQPDLMMLDEPTNFLDIEHIEWLAEFLNSFKGTFLVISHDTDFLDKVCKYIVSIENGMIRKYGGNYSQYLKLAEQNAKQYEDSYRRQQEEIEKMEEYIARNKARAATAGMANSRKKMLERMEKLNKPQTVYEAEFSFPCAPIATRELVKVSGLSIGYSSPLLPPISFTMDGTAKLWIRGTNGIGKTTLLKSVLGQLKALGGSVYLHPFIKIAYLEQELDFKNYGGNAVNYISDLFPKLQLKQVRAALAKSGIKNDLAVKPVKELSGGEQVRVKLTALSQNQSSLLVLDEPTNHLDVRAKAALKSALTAYNGAILLVSHEKDFAGEICSAVFDVRA